VLADTMEQFTYAGTLLRPLSKHESVGPLSGLGYPSTRKQFEGYQSFRTHDLDILLHLSGAESKIKTNYLAEWSIVATWDSTVRYRPIGSATAQDVADMLKSARAIVGAL